MASFNKVILVGNVTRDIEVRFTGGGTAVCEVGLAVNRNWRDKSTNEMKEEVTFVDITLWGRTAEVAGEYLKKGRPCLIEGRLQLDQWEDRETGAKRQKLKVVGEALQLLGSRQDGDGGSGGGQSRSSQQSQRAEKPAEKSADEGYYDEMFPDSESNDDVPF